MFDKKDSNTEIFILKCANGILKVYEEKVVISRNTFGGFISQSLKGDRTIFYNDLIGIEYRKPTIMVNGYIKFIIAGVQETHQNMGKLNAIALNVSRDPNALILRAFNKEVPKKSEEINNYILEKIQKQKTSNTNNISSADEIMKFKELLDQGIITQEEFEKKKKELL